MGMGEAVEVNALLVRGGAGERNASIERSQRDLKLTKLDFHMKHTRNCIYHHIDIDK